MSDRTCPTCLNIYRYPSMLKTHFENVYHCKKTIDEVTAFFILNKENKSNNEYKCNKCSKSFKNIKALNRHSKETVCGKSQTVQLNSTATTNINNNNNNNNNTFNIPRTHVETNNTTSIINNDTMCNDIASFNYIYLIEKFDVNNKEYIYKFGKTNRECSKRLKEHGDEAKVLLIIDVDNCNVIEKKILHILSNTENIRKCSFGNEYFLCNDKEFIKSIILKNI
jgi:hypothetical protein